MPAFSKPAFSKPGRVIIAVLIVLLSTMLSVTRPAVSAQEHQNDEEFIFGTVGLTPAQTARLNVVNIATDGRAQTRVLKFLDTAGNVILDASGQPVMQTVTLAPGEAAYLDLNGAALGSTGRAQIRALDPTCPGCNGNSPHGIIQTLELFDSITGRTEILYAPNQFKPEGPPNSPVLFGMVGLVGGQTLRLSVTAPPSPITPPSPIRILLSFARSDGQLITNADGHPLQPELTLLPGQSASFDLSADLILAVGETRAEVRPVLIPNGPPNRLIPTLEVIDDATAKTAVLYAPVTRACGASQ